jgi:exoribonuclease II
LHLHPSSIILRLNHAVLHSNALSLLFMTEPSYHVQEIRIEQRHFIKRAVTNAIYVNNVIDKKTFIYDLSRLFYFGLTPACQHFTFRITLQTISARYNMLQ